MSMLVHVRWVGGQKWSKSCPRGCWMTPQTKSLPILELLLRRHRGDAACHDVHCAPQRDEVLSIARNVHYTIEFAHYCEKKPAMMNGSISTQLVVSLTQKVVLPTWFTTVVLTKFLLQAMQMMSFYVRGVSPFCPSVHLKKRQFCPQKSPPSNL